MKEGKANTFLPTQKPKKCKFKKTWLYSDALFKKIRQIILCLPVIVPHEDGFPSHKTYFGDTIYSLKEK